MVSLISINYDKVQDQKCCCIFLDEVDKNIFSTIAMLTFVLFIFIEI